MSPFIEHEETHGEYVERVTSPAEPVAPTTQTRHPWRATLRTVVAAVIAAGALLPLLLPVIDGWVAEHPELVPSDVAGVITAITGGIIAVTGLITRLLAVPGVDDFLRRYVPVLGSAPANE